MLKDKKFNPTVLIPSKRNIFIWFNAIFLLMLLSIGYADTLTIIMAYFLETIIIGFIQIFKLYKIISNSNSSKAKYSLIVFFLFHYSFFVAVQLIFVFVFVGMKDSNIGEPFNLIENLTYVLSIKGMTTVLLSIFAYNLFDFLVNFIGPKVYLKMTVEKAFIQPYTRIFVQQFAVILGGFFLMFTSALFAVGVLIIVFKTIIDLTIVSGNIDELMKVDLSTFNKRRRSR